MLLEEFNKEAAGSAYHLGDTNSKCKVVFLHGHGMSARGLKNPAKYLEKHFPGAHIIVPNGSYHVPVHTIRKDLSQGAYYRYTPFTWFDFNNDEEVRRQDALKARLEELKSDPENRIYMVGFSIGGQRAADEFIKAASQGIHGAVLHGSAMVHLPKQINEKPAEKNAPAELYTIMGLKDPFLRTHNSLKRLWSHYCNQKTMRKAGYSAETTFYWDLKHNMTEPSMEDVAEHLKKRDNYVLGNS